ncbi:MAG: hypothetical protein IJH79_20805 [Lentisphaeria bacterium]|nr:hypothetical protein [Lentisphaeria bacterium]
MTEKGRVLHQLRNMSSGTIAGLIGSDKYVIIDRAATTAVLYVSNTVSEDRCREIQTMEDLCSIFLEAQK